MPYPALAIANYFIHRGMIDGQTMDHLRLQKLVYISHGWNLAIYGSPLIHDRVEAWKYGPVVSSLYQHFKRYGNDEIREPEIVFDSHGGSVPSINPDDASTLAILERVWELYKPYSGVQLSNLTHEAGSPWAQTWEQNGGRRHAQIDDRLIAEHFRGLALKKRNAA